MYLLTLTVAVSKLLLKHHTILDHLSKTSCALLLTNTPTPQTLERP